MKPFIRTLIQQRGLARLGPNQIAIFNVAGKYGHYQVRIGPVNPRTHTRPVEINGEVHHLFVTRDRITAMPTHDEINKNLRGTVIMKDITVHLFDSRGDGHEVKIMNMKEDGAHPHDHINLAGREGEKLISEFESNSRFANETYRIVQEDILKSF